MELQRNIVKFKNINKRPRPTLSPVFCAELADGLMWTEPVLEARENALLNPAPLTRSSYFSFSSNASITNK